jgi:hypothetical protein
MPRSYDRRLWDRSTQCAATFFAPALTRHVSIVPRAVVAFENVAASDVAASRAWTNTLASGERIAALNPRRPGRQSRQSRRRDPPLSEAGSRQLDSSRAGTDRGAASVKDAALSVLITKGGATMSIHDAEGVSQRRRAQGIQPHGRASVPRSLQNGTELQRLKSIPWPRNLFGEPATIEDLLAPRATRDEESLDNLCMRGRGKERRPSSAAV